MRYQINNGSLNELSDIPINPFSEEINNFDNGVTWYEDNDGFLYNYLKISNINILLNKISFPYLKFSSDDNFTLSVSRPGWSGTIEYSLDKGNTWTIWDGTTQLSGDENNPIYLRGIGNTKITGSNSNKWSFTGKYVIGNIENLLNYQTVINRQHPAMDSYCYNYMFYNCTSLITAPELPATTLTGYCYRSMFENCSSLITPPDLPATTLADFCYSYMFKRCTSLTTSPKLLATTLANNCCANMFSDCTSLVTTPNLFATTLTNYCYAFMFYNCSSLTTISELPATTLASDCYNGMFYGCTSLTTLPKLPATTLIDNCYQNMFQDCTSLKLSATQTDSYQYSYRIPTSGTGTTARNALSSMFTNTGGTFTGAPTINTTYWTDHQPI